SPTTRPLVAGYHEADTEADHRNAAGHAETADALGRPAEPVARRAGTERVEAVADEADDDEDRAKQQHLHADRHRPVRDELRQDRQKEHDRLRVGHADDKALEDRAQGANRLDL